MTVAAVSDEETGAQWGSKHIVENYPEYRGDALISGEPSSNGIIRFAERGRAWVDLGVRGESAHTCSVPRGLSATETLIDFLQDVKEIPELESFQNVPDDFREVIVGAREQMDAAYGDGATDRILVPRVNVGILEGGEKVNLVAENARAEVDIRLPIGTTSEQTQEYLESLAADHPGEIRIEGAEGASNPFKDPTYSDYEHPIFQHLQRSAGEVRDQAPSFSCALAGTDCAYYRAEGVPAAVYGPTPHNLGSQNEYITVDDFMEVVKSQAMASAAYMAEADR